MVLSKENLKKKSKKLTKKHKKPQRSKKGKKVSKPVKKKTLKGKLSKLHGGTFSGSGLLKEAIKNQIRSVIKRHHDVVVTIKDLFKSDSFLKGIEAEAAAAAKKKREMDEKMEKEVGEAESEPVENEFQREFNEYKTMNKEIVRKLKDPRYKDVFIRNLVLNLLMPSLYHDKSTVPVIGYLYDVAYDVTWGGVKHSGLNATQKLILRKYLPINMEGLVFQMWLDMKREKMKENQEYHVSQPQQQGGSEDEGVEPTSMMPNDEEVKNIFLEALEEGGVETVPVLRSTSPL